MMISMLVAAIVAISTVLLVSKQARKRHDALVLEAYAEWLKSQPQPKQESTWHPNQETIRKLRAKYRHVIDPDAKAELNLASVDVERVINLD